MHINKERDADLQRRVAALELANRRLTVGCGLLVVGILALLTVAAKPVKPEVVEARRVVIRDAVGTPRLVLEVGSAGAQIALSDSGGTRRLVLASEAPMLHERFAGGEPGVEGPALLLTGPSSAGDAQHVILQSGAAASGLWVRRNKTLPRIALAVQSLDGSYGPQLQLLNDENATGVLAAVFGEEPALWPGGPSIVIRDKSGRFLFKAP